MSTDSSRCRIPAVDHATAASATKTRPRLCCAPRGRDADADTIGALNHRTKRAPAMPGLSAQQTRLELVAVVVVVVVVMLAVVAVVAVMAMLVALTVAVVLPATGELLGDAVERDALHISDALNVDDHRRSGDRAGGHRQSCRDDRRGSKGVGRRAVSVHHRRHVVAAEEERAGRREDVEARRAALAPGLALQRERARRERLSVHAGDLPERRRIRRTDAVLLQ